MALKSIRKGCWEASMCCQQKSDESTRKSDLPIDRGWAWVIILASAGMFAIIAGTYKCFGIIKLEILSAYPDCSQDTSMWILSLSSAISLMSGPIVSLMLTYLSHRTVGLIGAFLFSSGFLLSAFAPNCYFFFFSFSVLNAIGGGALLVVCFTAFAPYFLKHRALAVGLMASGSGIGGVVLPPLVTYLFENFAFRESIILYSSVCVHTFVFASLLRPLSYYEELSKKRKQKEARIRNMITTTVTANTNQEKAPVPLINIDAGSSTSSDQRLAGSDDEFRTRCHSQGGRGPIKTTDASPILFKSLPFSLDRIEDRTSHNHVSAIDKAELLGSAISLSAIPTVVTTNHIHSGNHHTSQSNNNSAAGTNIKTKRTEKNKYDWSMWIHPKAITVCVMMFFAITSSCLFIATTPSFALEFGVMMDKLSTIMAITGACEVFCRIINGWVADRKIITALTQLTIVMVLNCVAAGFAALLPGLTGVTILYTIMAVIGSSMFSLLPIVYIELFGVEYLTTLTGMNNVYQALAFIASAPIANILHSTFQTWHYVMVYISACFGVSAIIGFAFTISIYHISRRQLSVTKA